MKPFTRLSIFMLGILIVPLFVSADTNIKQICDILRNIISELHITKASILNSVNLLCPAEVAVSSTNESVACINAKLITKDLYMGIPDDPQIKYLQIFLNNSGFLINQPSSPNNVGSLGYETTHFGTRTEVAVQKWQAQNNVVSSGLPETTGYGKVGPSTREKMVSSACNTTLSTQKADSKNLDPKVFQKNISYAGVNVDVVISQPDIKDVDVLLVYHGTTGDDSEIVNAAEKILENIKDITERDDFLIISVAYPEEGLLMGDALKESEAALLWTKYNANKELGVNIKKIFLVGHSLGGYMVTRLNTMYETDGVIANGPGPLDLDLRCKLDEKQISLGKSGSKTCSVLMEKYGSVNTNPTPYIERSLLSFTDNYKSNILFIQGGNDTQIQMKSWPTFKDKVNNCKNCKKHVFLDIPDVAHAALFLDSKAMAAYNNFIK